VILVTGGAGFIGSNFILNWLAHRDEPVLNVDKLTYAGNAATLRGVEHDSRYVFAQVDICDREAIDGLIQKHQPRAILHFAAESHVDRSIRGPGEFVQTNVVGTFTMLEAATAWYRTLSGGQREAFRFLHVSTDEVYGSLEPNDPAFNERTPYAPSSPYSASKAASDHLVRAWHHTYGLPTLTTNCSNNYGPYQFAYGDGRNVRDWLYVEDHCEAIDVVLDRGVPGETYNIGGCNELANIDVVKTICRFLDELKPTSSGVPYAQQIQFVTDRPGHDRRYAIDARRIESELGWI